MNLIIILVFSSFTEFILDANVKVSLRGGHVWEFTCDEDDPIVLGLVSALPGASLDSTLPSDGLIQVESPKGERMFLTRSSLVAVTVSRCEPRAPNPDIAEPDGTPPQGVVTPARFVLFPDFFDEEMIAPLIALGSWEEPAGDFDGDVFALSHRHLPASVVSRLTGGIGEAWRTMGAPGDDDSHLDVRSFRIHSSVAEAPEREKADRDILHFLFHLPVLGGGLNGAGVVLADRQAGKAAPDQCRRVVLRANSLLVWQASSGCGPVLLDWGPGGSALLVSGALRRGRGDGQG